MTQKENNLTLEEAIKNEYPFDACLDILKNSTPSNSVIKALILKYIKTGNGFDSVKELKLAEVGCWKAVYQLLLLNKSAPSNPETLICFAKTLLKLELDLQDRSNIFLGSGTLIVYRILCDKIAHTTFSDEQFDRLLNIANDFTLPTNTHAQRYINAEIQPDLNLYVKSIPKPNERVQCLRAVYNFDDWCITSEKINTGLLQQHNLTFERLYKVLKKTKECKTDINLEILFKILLSMKFTLSQLDMIIKLKISKDLQTLLGEIRNDLLISHHLTPGEAKVDLLAQTFEINGNSGTFQTAIIYEGKYDHYHRHLPTKKIILPSKCFKIFFIDDCVIFCSLEFMRVVVYKYTINTDTLVKYFDPYDDKAPETIDDAVTPINTNDIISKPPSKVITKGDRRFTVYY